MLNLLTTISLIGGALALSVAPRQVETCKGIGYRCAAGFNGWEVCDGTGHWVTGGWCATGQYCWFDTANGSPYCLPSGNPTPECTWGMWKCSADLASYDYCVSNGMWEFAGACPTGTHCWYNAVDAQTHCIPSSSCTPGTFRCSAGGAGWEVCNASGIWECGGSCPAGTTCEFNTWNGSPYCAC